MFSNGYVYTVCAAAIKSSVSQARSVVMVVSQVSASLWAPLLDVHSMTRRNDREGRVRSCGGALVLACDVTIRHPLKWRRNSLKAKTRSLCIVLEG